MKYTLNLECTKTLQEVTFAHKSFKSVHSPLHFRDSVVKKTTQRIF